MPQPRCVSKEESKDGDVREIGDQHPIGTAEVSDCAADVQAAAATTPGVERGATKRAAPASTPAQIAQASRKC